jgi:O-antigen chain-terminating methyltransferase
MKFWPPSELLATLKRAAALPRLLKTQMQAVQESMTALEQKHQQLELKNEKLTASHAQLTDQQQQLQKNHDASVAWMQQMYPEIVSAIGKKLEQEHFDKLTQDVFAAVYSEVGAFSDRLDRLQHTAGQADPATLAGSTPANASAAAEDSRSAGFYLDLERRFRGTADEISARAQPYLSLLQTDPALFTPVLDIGSGRGEWLALLARENLSASGVDLNPINGHFCRSRGLEVRTGDAIAYLASLAPASLGTVTAFHLVEHLPFATLLALTDEILRVLKPGGLLIYETPNPENILVATQYFWIDPTHIKPLPPDLLHFLVLQRGFTNAEIRRLHPGEPSPTPDATLQALLSGPRDYAVIAVKPQLATAANLPVD